MKYLLISLLLTGCASAPTKLIKEYDCMALGRITGSHLTVMIEAEDSREAIVEFNRVVQVFIDKGITEFIKDADISCEHNGKYTQE